MSVICVLAMAIMASREVSGLMGSCREAKKCCEGKDPECGVTKVTVMMTVMMTMPVISQQVQSGLSLNKNLGLPVQVELLH